MAVDFWRVPPLTPREQRLRVFEEVARQLQDDAVQLACDLIGHAIEPAMMPMTDADLRARVAVLKARVQQLEELAS